MVLNLRPKCANPSCAPSFEWLAGGKLFRFHRNSSESDQAAAGANGSHGTGHYWPCERCSNITRCAPTLFEESQLLRCGPNCPRRKTICTCPPVDPARKR